MFQFDQQKVVLTHINTRQEKHGPDELALVVDLAIHANLSNDFLTQLAPTLKWSLYDKPVDGDLAQDAGYAPVLRYSQIAHIKWTGDMVGAIVVLHGTSKAKTLEFEAKVNKLVLECKDGGTVSIAFRVQTPVTPEQLALLCELLSKEFPISVMKAAEDLVGDGS